MSTDNTATQVIQYSHMNRTRALAQTSSRSHFIAVTVASYALFGFTAVLCFIFLLAAL